MKYVDLGKTERSIRLLTLAIACILFIMLVMFGASNLGIINSGFTVKLADENKNKALSLSRTGDFEKPVSTLICKVPDYMFNISGASLPDGLDETDDQHNGKNYIAFTFYVRNVGEEAITLAEEMTINANIFDALDAIRIRIYRNDEKTDYAKQSAQGGKEEVFCDKAFLSGDKVFELTNPNFNPQDTIKYTVVIWIEGDDPECLDNIRGGSVKLSMSFSVVDDES